MLWALNLLIWECYYEERAGRGGILWVARLVYSLGKYVMTLLTEMVLVIVSLLVDWEWLVVLVIHMFVIWSKFFFYFSILLKVASSSIKHGNLSQLLWLLIPPILILYSSTNVQQVLYMKIFGIIADLGPIISSCSQTPRNNNSN